MSSLTGRITFSSSQTGRGGVREGAAAPAGAAPSLFPGNQEAQRTVHRDGFVEVAKAYYEAPPERIGRKVWVQWDGRRVAILNDRQECLVAHVALEPGKFTRTRDVRGLDGGIDFNIRR